MSCLQRYQEFSSKRLESLQKTLNESVPYSELETASKRYALLASRHRDLLEQLNTLSSDNFSLLGKLQSDINADRKNSSSQEQQCLYLSTKLKDTEVLNMELETKLSERISKEVHENNQKRTMELESQISDFHLEVANLKSLAEVAHYQAKTIESSRETLLTEVQQLRGRILNIVSESDKNISAVQLYCETHEVELKSQLDKLISEIQRHQVQYTLLEQRYEEKENELQLVQNQSRNKIVFLTQALQELRRQFSATMPLNRQEKLIQELMLLRTRVASTTASAPSVMARNLEMFPTAGTVEDLKLQLKEAEEALLDRDIAVAHLRSLVPTTAEMPIEDHNKAKQALQVAQSTIAYLQSRLKQKEETAGHYQQLLERLRSEVDEQQKKQSREVKELQTSLQKAQHTAVASATEFATELAARPGSASRNLTNELMAKVNQLEETASLQENHLATLSKKLHESRQESTGLQAEVEKVTASYHLERQRIKDLEKQIRDLENENRRQAEELSTKVQDLQDLRSEDEAAAPLFKTVEKLQLELQAKEEKLKEMKDSLIELRQEMTELVQDGLIAKREEEDLPSVQKIVDEKTKKFQEQLQNSLSRVRELQEQLNQKDERVQDLLLGVETAKTERDQKEEQLERVAREKEDLRRRFARLETSSRLELERLRKQVRELEEELNQRAEKPYEQDEKALKSKEEVVRWEESKKWQQTVDRLRQRLRTKEQELETLQKSSKSLREQVIRCGKEKASLENRIKFLSQKVAAVEQPLPVQELKAKVTLLEAELHAIRSSNKDELVEKNVLLLKRIDQLEHEVARNEINKQQISKGMEGNGDLKGKCNQLEKQVLRLTEENFELKLELEQLRVDLPRLRIQVASLEEYIENEVNSNKIEGKPNQLEITVGDDREDVQKGRHPFFPNKKVTAASKQLSPSTRRLLDTKTARIADENNRLQKELQKVKQELDRSRTKIRRFDQESKKLNESLEAKNREVADLRKRVPSPHTMGPHQYKAYVVTRMYEEKISGLEATLLQKKEQIDDVERLLKETTLNEERLLVERNHLRDKVDAYENIRLTVGADAEEQLRQVRTQLLKVTAEKSEMENIFESGGVDISNEQSKYGRLLRESAEVRVDLKTCQLCLQKRNEEITELKYELNVASERAKELEERNFELAQLTKRQQIELDKLSQRFGFT